MSEMLERIANSIAEALSHHGGLDIGRHLAIKAARAAVEAMREPTSAMIEGSIRHMDSYSSNLAWWQSMIDEALK